VFPALEHGLEDVALVELGVAHDRDHAPGGQIVGGHVLEPDVILGQRGESGHCNAEADRSGREVDVIAVLGPRRIGLGAAEGPESFQHIPALVAKQILDGMEDRAGVGLDRDPVGGTEDVEIERRHQGCRRRARRLVAADLEAVRGRPQMVGVMDHPRRQPQHLAFELPEHLQSVNALGYRGVGHGESLIPSRLFLG
jgi:hypothetical protein